MNWICSQIGAREHYAIPRALQSEGRLARLFTDLRRPGLGAINSRFVTSFPVGGLKWWGTLRYAQSPHTTFVRQGRWFSESVRNALRPVTVENHVFFGYDTGFLEAATELKDRGAWCVVGQMDPARTEFDLVAEERTRWPGWEEAAPPVPEAYHARREAEWKVADRVVVNSEWSRDALLSQGVPGEKLTVVPLCFEPTMPTGPTPISEKPPSKILEVLWLGQVNLRKGIPYLLQAAKTLRREPIRFTVVGPLSINRDKAAALAGSNVRFTGPVKRSEAAGYYRKADVFVLPTLSDGFALTQLEAMAHGLPVIATPRCGRVVSHDRDGFIVPIRDAKALEDRFLELAQDREKLHRFRQEAGSTARKFGLSQLMANLRSLEP